MEHGDLGRYVGVWIDSVHAVIAVPRRDDVITVASNTERHAFSGSAGHPGAHSPQTGGSEKRVTARHDQALVRFYDDVLSRIGHPEEVLVFGPGETKLHLRDRIEDTSGQPVPKVTVEAADAMTHGEIVAHVARHFGVRPVRLMPRT